MADEDEIDILGDFNLNSFSSEAETNMIDTAPLVSQNSDLLNCEYTIHPQWLLDKPSANPDNWYEANSASTSDVLDTDTLGHISTENYITDESGWTEKEKNLLYRGIEIFGKSSVRLSQFVGSKTASEVKYYLKNFFSENQPNSHHSSSDTSTLLKNIPNVGIVTEILDANQIPASIEEVVAVVSTASPTVKSPRERSRKYSLNNAASTSFNIKNTSITNRFPKIKIRNVQRKLSKQTNTLSRKEAKSRDDKPQLKQKSEQKIRKFKFKTKSKMDVSNCQSRKLKHLDEISQKQIIGQTEITTGKGLSVPICEGEEIVKIEHDDNSSDISIDVEDMEDMDSKTFATKNACKLHAFFTRCNAKCNSSQNNPKPQVKEELNVLSHMKLTGSEVECDASEPDNNMDFSHLNKDVVDILTSLEKPASEVTLDIHDITELEKAINYEFFENRPAKTPERYLKIRNHIISNWQLTKPNYITKTAMRLGLKNCGDVTCISKIHNFLEQTGAINFGCEQTKYDRPLYNLIQVSDTNKHKSMKLVKKQISREPTGLGSRKRIKKFIHDGEGGCTLVHGDQGEIIKTTVVNEEPTKTRTYVKKPQIHLIYCRPFTDDKPQEYSVKVSLSSLILMDFHAHMYLTEVMGLVGGFWNFKEKALTISCYEPCKNIASSSTHCDMCPISQAKAAESIHNNNLQILGWFHSHPTFAPEPSQQDLDTQKFVQQWLGHSRPCIGVILTPFSINGALISSPFRCLMVDRKPNFDDQIVPYRFNVDVDASDFDVSNFLTDMRRMLFFEDEYLKEKRIIFHEPYFQDITISHVDKFISSVNMHLAKNGNLRKSTCDQLINGIRDLLLFSSQSNKKICT